MSMISFVFIAFSAIVYAAVYFTEKVVLDREKRRLATKWIFLIASYSFVLYADYRFAIILLGITLVTWYCARKELYRLGIIVILAFLGVFKYADFFIDSFARMLGTEGMTLRLILPLGISFYAFSAISYIVDVKRKKQSPRSLIDVSVYLAFFLKLTSGPVQRSGEFFYQINQPRCLGWGTFCQGIQIVVFGVFKKLVLADRLSVFVNQVYMTPKAFSSFTVIMAIIAYSFQIYFDFSGYSDIAIGMAKIFGFEFPSNFNLPYLSRNVTELWKRWHITLSSWLQDYLYVSLGGSRKGKVRRYVNLLMTMTIGGLWHGANWTYIVWGMLHGIALIVHKIWMQRTNSAETRYSAVANACSVFVTFMFTSLCWIFFRADSIEQAMSIIIRAFSFQQGISQVYFWLLFAGAVWLISIIAAAMHSKKNAVRYTKYNMCAVEGYYPVLDLSRFGNLVLFFVFCGLIVCFAYTGGSPFIYGNY